MTTLADVKLERLEELRELKAKRDRLVALHEDLNRRKLRRETGLLTPGDLALKLNPQMVQTPALDLIDAELVELVDNPERNRLMVFMPPQEGKSERVSHYFPLWLLWQKPDTRIAIVSYQDEMARRWGSAIKMDVEQNSGYEGELDLGLTLRSDSKSAGRWQVHGRMGGVYCVGISGALTGKPADLIIFDDPFKDLEQAQSLVYRERAKNFWRAVAVPRLAPTSKVIIVQTRWHQDDLSGWLLNEQPERWRVVSIPAISEHPDEMPKGAQPDALERPPGTPMVSARGNRDWAAIKQDVGEYVWGALYQQHPSPAEGGIFKREWWKRFDSPRWVVRPNGQHIVPGADEVVMSWDMSFKDSDESSYVCGQVWARFGLQVFLVDQVHDRMDFVRTVSEFRQLVAKWPQAIAKYVEEKANGVAVINMLAATIPGIIPIEPDGSKLARARAVTPFFESGQINVPAPELAPWVGGLIEEAALFPNAAHDDRVDATTQAVNRLLLNPILTETVLDTEELDEELDSTPISIY